MQDPPDLDADDDSFDLVADLVDGGACSACCVSRFEPVVGVRGVSRTGEFFFP